VCRKTTETLAAQAGDMVGDEGRAIIGRRICTPVQGDFLKLQPVDIFGIQTRQFVLIDAGIQIAGAKIVEAAFDTRTFFDG